jgi:addiction module RelE/StbE family toxin
MRVFNRHKRATPPEPLPAKMSDHKLDGPLRGFMECHLDDDILLIYKTMPKGAIKLFRVCTHADLKGPKAKALTKLLKK